MVVQVDQVIYSYFDYAQSDCHSERSRTVLINKSILNFVSGVRFIKQ